MPKLFDNYFTKYYIQEIFVKWNILFFFFPSTETLWKKSPKTDTEEQHVLSANF